MNLTERQVAERNNISLKKVQTMRAQHCGPYWVDLNNQGRTADKPSAPMLRKPLIRYPLARLEEWEGSQQQAAV